MVIVEFHNKDIIDKFIVKLPSRIDKEMFLGNELFMQQVRKSAKLRAPRDTGFTAKNIRLEKTKQSGMKHQFKIVVDSRAGVFQELGFEPHWVHSDQIDRSNKLKKEGFYFVSKSKPFLLPALEHNINKYFTYANRSIKRAIR